MTQIPLCERLRKHRVYDHKYLEDIVHPYTGTSQFTTNPIGVKEANKAHLVIVHVNLTHRMTYKIKM
jgi:hypothetical protein